MCAFYSRREQRGAGQAGFTLVELMVGMAVGLLATLVIAQVLSTSEGFKRSATSGSDAQVNGGLAIYAIQRRLAMAGYGLTTESSSLGCALSSRYGAASMPPTLAPALITAGVNGAPDTLRILASSKGSFSLPTRLKAPFYDPNDAGDKAVRMSVTSSLGVDPGDLMVIVYGADAPCQVFQASGVGLGVIHRVDGGNWNQNKFPDLSAAPPVGVSPLPPPPILVNLGAFSDVSFTVTPDKRLRQTMLSHISLVSSSQDLQSNIVAFRALYGKDTDADGRVDTYDAVTPANSAAWRQLRAIRVAVLARSSQYEKEEVTQSLPVWNLGGVNSAPGSSACGASKCIDLNADFETPDWKHYRYKVFDAVVPLRNQLWQSTP